MECKEFREKISAGNDFDNEMIEHKEKCSECQKWIEKELSTAPSGVSEEAWNKAVSKCLPTAEKESDNSKPAENDIKSDSEENKTFMDYYLSGLKYGIVFGLAIVVGFAIIQNKNETNKVQNANKEINTASGSLNLASSSLDLSIATDTEILPLPVLK